MKKKIIFALIALLTIFTYKNVSALEANGINYDFLKQDEDIPNQSYIIGKALFTREGGDKYNGQLTTTDIIHGAQTIENITAQALNNYLPNGQDIVYYKDARGVWYNALTEEAIDMPSVFPFTNYEDNVRDEQFIPCFPIIYTNNELSINDDYDLEIDIKSINDDEHNFNGYVKDDNKNYYEINFKKYSYYDVLSQFMRLDIGFQTTGNNIDNYARIFSNVYRVGNSIIVGIEKSVQGIIPKLYIWSYNDNWKVLTSSDKEAQNSIGLHENFNFNLDGAKFGSCFVASQDLGVRVGGNILCRGSFEFNVSERAPFSGIKYTISYGKGLNLKNVQYLENGEEHLVTDVNTYEFKVFENPKNIWENPTYIFEVVDISDLNELYITFKDIIGKSSDLNMPDSYFIKGYSNNFASDIKDFVPEED